MALLGGLRRGWSGYGSRHCSWPDVVEESASKAVALLQETKDVGDNIFTGGNKDVYVLKNFKTLEKLIKDICDENMTTD